MHHSGIDRKTKARRFTAVTCVLMTEVQLGGTLLIWQTSDSTVPATVAGVSPTGWKAVTVIAMTLSGLATVILTLAARLPRVIVTGFLAGDSIAIASIGALAFAQLEGEPSLTMPLMMAAALACPVIVEIRRAVPPIPGTARPEREHRWSRT